MSSNTSTERQSKRINKKRKQLRERMRRQDLHQMFQKKRKEIQMDTQNELQKQYLQTSGESVINQYIQQIINKQNYSDAVDSIWKICIMGLKTRLLTKANIAVLSKQFVELAKRSTDTNNQKELMMLSWIIGNWCFYFSDLPSQMCEMVKTQILILGERNSSVKFNQLILHHLTNTCWNQQIRVVLLQNRIVGKIVRCRVFQDRQSDKSTFLSNFLYNLPYRYKITQQCKQQLIIYLKQTYEMSKLDYLLRLDTMLILSKLLIINQGKYHTDVVRHLTPNLQLSIQKIQDDIKLESLQDILELITRLYRQRNYTSHDSPLYSEEIYRFIWKTLQQHILYTMQEYDQKVEAIQNQIWNFMYQFCQISSQTITDIHHYLFNLCLNKQVGDYQQRVVKILVKCYQHYDQETFQFWVDQLIELHTDQYICVDLLKIIKICLVNSVNPSLLFSRNEKLGDLLNKLIFDQNQQISKLSYEIVHFKGNQTMSLQQQSTKGANKSFNTICQVLSTPLQVTSSHSTKQQHPSTFTTLNQSYD